MNVDVSFFSPVSEIVGGTYARNTFVGSLSGMNARNVMPWFVNAFPWSC